MAKRNSAAAAAQNQIQQLRLIIRDELSKCNEEVTPNICKRITTREGYKEVEDLVINYAVHNNMSVQSAISHLDMELS